jgi:hypothetical protein
LWINSNFYASKFTKKDGQETMFQKENRDSALVVFAIVLIVVAVLVGTVIGLALGWLVLPVEWVDLPPSALADVYREDYLRMAIDSYALNDDCALAIQRYKALGEVGPSLLEGIIADSGEKETDNIAAFAQCVKD